MVVAVALNGGQVMRRLYQPRRMVQRNTRQGARGRRPGLHPRIRQHFSC
jgi:hypothetical protein